MVIRTITYLFSRYSDRHELSGNQLSVCGDGSDYSRGDNYGSPRLASVSGNSVDLATKTMLEDEVWRLYVAAYRALSGLPTA